jgi:hypothetical protein
MIVNPNICQILDFLFRTHSGLSSANSVNNFTAAIAAIIQITPLMLFIISSLSHPSQSARAQQFPPIRRAEFLGWPQIGKGSAKNWYIGIDAGCEQSYSSSLAGALLIRKRKWNKIHSCEIDLGCGTSRRFVLVNSFITISCDYSVWK